MSIAAYRYGTSGFVQEIRKKINAVQENPDGA